MDDERQVRQRIVKRAARLSAGLLAAAVVVAVAGSALIAWLALPNMPFFMAWLLVMGVVVVGVSGIVAVQRVLAHRQRTQ